MLFFRRKWMSLFETPSLVYLTAYSEIFFSVFGPISMIIINKSSSSSDMVVKLKRKKMIFINVCYLSSSWPTNEWINKNRKFYKFKRSSVCSASLLDSINVDKRRFTLRIECVIDSFNKWMNSIGSGFLLVNITNQKHKRSKVWNTVKLICLPQKKKWMNLCESEWRAFPLKNGIY